MVPENIYRGSVKSWGLGKAQTGTYQFQLVCQFTEAAKDADALDEGFVPLEKPLSKTIFLPITANTKAGALADLQFIGYDRATLSSASLIPGSPASFDFKNRPVVAQCQHDNWNGRDREKWRICRRKASAKMAREDISQFDNLFAKDDEEVSADLPI